MVFDPVSAFALACNILQVVETASRVLDKAVEYRSAGDGMLAEQRDLRTTVVTLGNLNHDLEAALTQAGGVQTHNATEERLAECNEECLRLSQDFVRLLDQLKVNKSGALIETIGKAVKSMRYKDRIEAVGKNLSRARENLTISFMIYMESKQATRSDVIQSRSSIEQNIAQLIDNSSTLTHTQVQNLSQRLEGLNLDAVQPMLSEFASENRQVLNDILVQLRAICAAQTRLQDQTAQAAQRKLLQSFYFNQMFDRRSQIPEAYHDTYRWILSSEQTNTKWDNLMVWLNDPQAPSNIYWINSKPGAGKSSLIRFLDGELVPLRHMQGWIKSHSFVRVHHYFWNPGSSSQKSLSGFLNSAMYQICEQDPEMLANCVPHHKYALAQNLNSANITWTLDELKVCLERVVACVASSTRFFFLIDGLDEVEVEHGGTEHLAEFLRELSDNPNVKLCVSSRRWTVFQDAFTTCPQLRLEDLNRQDIELFVRGQLESHSRYAQMLLYDDTGASDLASTVTERSDGVFLWASLVAKDLLRGLRDGDSSRTLLQKLNEIPDELGTYFGRLMTSVDPRHRWEASALLQIALFKEDQFEAVQPLRLVDLIFIEDANTDFALKSNHKSYPSHSFSAEALFYQLDSALRRLSSRCKGLLECYWDPEVASRGLASWHAGHKIAELLDMQSHAITALPNSLLPAMREHKHAAFGLCVEFMHRSLLDYLLEAGPQRLLQDHFGGRLDVRNYLRNARLMQIPIVMDAIPALTVGLASYVISTLSIPRFRDDRHCARFASKLQVVENCMNQGCGEAEKFWYIQRSLEARPGEQGNFLTLSIDFALTGYISRSLTSDIVHMKSGRPLLDYALRPRFSDFSGSHAFGNRYPLPDLVRSLLAHGADPNQSYNGISVFALFLCFLVDMSRGIKLSASAKQGYILSLGEMITHGAATSIAESNLSAPFAHGVFSPFFVRPAALLNAYTVQSRFFLRWPSLSRRFESIDGSDLRYNVTEIIECMRSHLGDAINEVKQLAQQRSETVELGLLRENPASARDYESRFSV